MSGKFIQFWKNNELITSYQKSDEWHRMHKVNTIRMKKVNGIEQPIVTVKITPDLLHKKVILDKLGEVMVVKSFDDFLLLKSKVQSCFIDKLCAIVKQPWDYSRKTENMRFTDADMENECI